MKFHNLVPTVELRFWNMIYHKKLDELGLCEDPIPIWGSYSSRVPQENIPSHLFIESLEKPTLSPFRVSIPGEIYLVNSMNSFYKTFTQHLPHHAKQLVTCLFSGDILHHTNRIMFFSMLAFINHKTYDFTFWFCFPTFRISNFCSTEAEIPLKQFLPPEKFTNAENSIIKFVREHRGDHIFFYFCSTDIVLAPHQIRDDHLHGNDFLVCVLDSSSTSSPGWPMRNAILLACAHWASMKRKMPFVSLRVSSKDSISNSMYYLFSLTPVTPEILAAESPTGWLKDERNMLGPQSFNLSNSLDPVILCQKSNRLNLTLMNWRRQDKVDLKKIEQTSCLIIGSGTLGCHIARCLMGWNVLKIGFVDNSRVSYSNLSRQCLFTFEDVSKPKAETAAMRVRTILPFLDTEGHNLSIMIPERSIPLTEAALAEFDRDFTLLRSLIRQYDVIFIALDSREVRWLPTVMCLAENKPAINVALGFDSFIVQRHRTDVGRQSNEVTEGLVDGSQFGCYFCSDMSAPSDVGSEVKTLDQQCTTVRPGVSQVCAGMAVELLISALHHPDGLMAPVSLDRKVLDLGYNGVNVGSLGSVPHMVRGDVATCDLVRCVNFRNNHCSACSANVVEKFRESDKLFVLDVCNIPNHLDSIVEKVPDTNCELVEFFSD